MGKKIKNKRIRMLKMIIVFTSVLSLFAKEEMNFIMPTH